MAHWQGREPDPAEDQLSTLLESAAVGDERAWREIVERFGRRVFALARSRCRNTDVAEEITQSVFATVSTKLREGLYTERGRFESWLFRITMNRVRDEVRRVRRQPLAPDPGVALAREPERGAGAMSTGAADARELDALRRALAGLNESDREVVELRHHAGMSFKQISDLLDEPVGTLLARHHRALRKLKEIMELAQESSKDQSDRLADRPAL